ncbi:hypothetical protein evm_015383, partial [Chilo suppressalis]
SHPLPVIYIDSPATPMTLDSPGELSSQQQHETFISLYWGNNISYFNEQSQIC